MVEKFQIDGLLPSTESGALPESIWNGEGGKVEAREEILRQTGPLLSQSETSRGQSETSQSQLEKSNIDLPVVTIEDDISARTQPLGHDLVGLNAGGHVALDSNGDVGLKLSDDLGLNTGGDLAVAGLTSYALAQKYVPRTFLPNYLSLAAFGMGAVQMYEHPEKFTTGDLIMMGGLAAHYSGNLLSLAPEGRLRALGTGLKTGGQIVSIIGAGKRADELLEDAFETRK